METDDIPAEEDSESFGSLADGDLENNDEDDDDALKDNWVEELECALLAECDPATLKKICEGKKIPPNLRPDYWRTLLALNDTERVKLTSKYDLNNQDELRRDCELLVNEISNQISLEPLPESEVVRLRNSFESTITTYVKARPELEYVAGNGWTDILKVLYHLQLDDVQLYQMFFRIVDRYIPKDLSLTKRQRTMQHNYDDDDDCLPKSGTDSKKSPIMRQKISPPIQSKPATESSRIDLEKSVQAYHLLRLLIQYHDPELCSILDSKKVTPNLYVKDWFCSLFARSCSPELALQIWDMHFKMADPFLIFFAAIVMVVNASDELKKSNMSQQDMLNVLKVMPSKLEEDDIEDLYYLVSNHYTYSTPRSIRSYSHLFFMDTFGNTYSGNDSPDRNGSPTFVDSNTTRLTSSIDLSQYLCLPIVPAEIFALETTRHQQEADSSPDLSPTSTTNQPLRYFLVDCRPAEQYNAGHLNKAFHLDCSLMLREPPSFATAVQALLEIQRQVVASKSNTGGQHLCFIGSGQEEEDQYVNMVVASFLQKYQKFVSIVYGGFDAIHDYVKTKSELCESFNKYIVDHNEELCKACCSGSPEAMERLRIRTEMALNEKSTAHQAGGLSSALFATTSSLFKGDKTSAQAALSKFVSSNPQTNTTSTIIAQSGEFVKNLSMFDKFTAAVVSKSSILKDRLVETIKDSAIPNSAYAAARSHVSSQDRLGPRYMGSGSALSDDGQRRPSVTARLDDAAASLLSFNVDRMHGQFIDEEPCQEVQIDTWQQENDIMAIYKCSQIKGTNKYPGYVALNKKHLWVLREIPHNKGFASIAAKRPLDMVVKIVSKRKQPDFITFHYGHTSNSPGGSNFNSPVSSNQMDEVKASKSSEQDAKTNISTTKPQRPLQAIIASDNLHIPQAHEVIRLIKGEILRVMSERSRKNMARPIVEQPGRETLDCNDASELEVNESESDGKELTRMDNKDAEDKDQTSDNCDKNTIGDDKTLEESSVPDCCAAADNKTNGDGQEAETKKESSQKQ